MTSSNWSPISLGSDSVGPDPVPAISVWRGVSQLAGFAVRMDAGFSAVRGRGLVAAADPSPSARRRATACLQLISTGQVQMASIPTIRRDLARLTMTETP
jgi:hypothetical protein